jgi:DNA-binding transcriptional ArsR family regulator
VLRSAGLVDAERDGREVRYRLADPDVIVACDVMRGVLERRLGRLAGLVSEAGGPGHPATAEPEAAAIPEPVTVN